MARYAVLVTSATTMILLAVYITAPPKMLDYCGEAHDQVIALLHEALEAGARRAIDSDDPGDTRGDALARVNGRYVLTCWIGRLRSDTDTFSDYLNSTRRDWGCNVSSGA